MVKRYNLSEALQLAAFHIGQKLSEYRSFAQSTHAAIDANQDDPDVALMLQRDAAAYDANAEVFSQAAAAIADRQTLAAQAALYRDALQRIAYTSSNPGSQGNELTHAERWLEKAAWAREALESTTAGQSLLDRQKELEEALKPFALIGEVIAYPDMIRMVSENNGKRGVAVYAVDFRKAAAALQRGGVRDEADHYTAHQPGEADSP